jgi:hypothetical protein
VCRKEKALMVENRRFQLDITGEYSLAGYFLLAHWPNPDTAPELSTVGGKTVIDVDVDGQGLADLRKVLRELMTIGGVMGDKAADWSRELDGLGFD